MIGRHRMKKWLSLFLALLTAGALAFAATNALAGEEGEGVEAAGGCTMGSEWKLHMGTEIGVEFEVNIETRVPGQRWNVELHYNGHNLIREVEETEEDGGFEIRRVENNAPGEDSASMRAKNPETGETCEGELTAEL
jgi:hypothetical protein